MSRQRVAWVVGGGGGIGAACAAHLAAAGFRVAISGRNPEALEEVRGSIEAEGGLVEVVPVDVTLDGSVTAAVGRIRELGQLALVVISSGTNMVRRDWDVVSSQDFDRVVDTNLTSVARVTIATLPLMRQGSDGQIIVVSSWSGWTYFAPAGPAYLASKRGLGAIVESINDQEGRNGIRATHLCPGEVSTPIVLTRPVPPTPEEFERMLQPDHVADVVGMLAALPPEVCVNELVMTATHRDMYGVERSYRSAPE